MIVVEGQTGPSGVIPGNSLQPGGDGRPDLWIQSTRNLGDGSTTVCDTGSASAGGGGVPGINPPSFADGDPAITDALNDFACRFDPFVSASAPCTLVDKTRESKLINPDADVQFCDFVGTTAVFPPGDSIVSVRLRDVAGNLGPTAQVVVRVATPTPGP